MGLRQYIFSFVFLLAMVSTLFQSSGLFEEEAAHAKTELSKKDLSKDSSDGSDSDEDAGDDAADSDFLNGFSAFSFSRFVTHTHSHPAFVNWYDHSFQSTHTRPPRA